MEQEVKNRERKRVLLTPQKRKMRIAICEKEPKYTMWKGQFKPEIHQVSCGRCLKVVRGYSKGKAVERWNKFVLEYDFCSYGERKDNGKE